MLSQAQRITILELHRQGMAKRQIAPYVPGFWARSSVCRWCAEKRTSH